MTNIDENIFHVVHYVTVNGLNEKNGINNLFNISVKGEKRQLHGPQDTTVQFSLFHLERGLNRTVCSVSQNYLEFSLKSTQYT